MTQPSVVAGTSEVVVVDTVITNGKLQVKIILVLPIDSWFPAPGARVDGFTLCCKSNHQVREDKENFTIVSQGRLARKAVE